MRVGITCYPTFGRPGWAGRIVAVRAALGRTSEPLSEVKRVGTQLRRVRLARVFAIVTAQINSGTEN
jgi:hypothetical protein